MTHAGRDGFAIMRWTPGGVNADNKPIHVIKSANHHNGFYDNIYNNQTFLLRATGTDIIVKKGQGNLNHHANWRHTGHFLRNQDREFTIITLTPRTVLPVIKANGFLPIRADPPVPGQAPAPAPLQAPVNTVKKYAITTIPQHAIRLMLLSATIEDETCPITGNNIDISNGAITSCFHLFDRDALAMWLAMPNSLDKCPVCNNPCNSYSSSSTATDEPPPLLR